MNLVSISSENVLSPIQRQAIMWTNAGVLSIGPCELQWNSNQNTKFFIPENAFENMICKMAAICPGKMVKAVRMSAFNDSNDDKAIKMMPITFHSFIQVISVLWNDSIHT